MSHEATREPEQLDEQQPALSSHHVAGLVFTGRGAEYFRIWVVNLLLTLLTLGVYSAWAKVRKARYFRVEAPRRRSGRAPRWRIFSSRPSARSRARAVHDAE